MKYSIKVMVREEDNGNSEISGIKREFSVSNSKALSKEIQNSIEDFTRKYNTRPDFITLIRIDK